MILDKSAIARFAILIFLIALILRLGFLFLHPKPLASDELDYNDLGSRLAATGRYSVEGHPTAYRPIGYPALIAVIYVLTGREPASVRIFQALCDSATALLLFLILLRRSRSAALLAGVVWAVLPAAVLFSSQLFSESLVAFGLVLFTYLLDRSPTCNERVLLPAALLLSSLVLIKPALLIFTVAFIAIQLRAWPRQTVLWFAGLTFLPIALWSARNLVVMHTPSLTTSTGINLLIGNNPRATGGYSDPGIPIPGTDERSRDSSAGRLAVQYVVSNPLTAVRTGVKKLLFLLSSEGELVVGNFRNDFGVAQGSFSGMFIQIPIWLHWLVSVPSLLVMILGTIGLSVRRTDMIGKIFACLVIALMISTVVFFGGSRFRFPAMPFLLLFCSVLVSEPAARAQALAHWRRSFCLAAVFVLVWAAEFYVVYTGSFR